MRLKKSLGVLTVLMASSFLLSPSRVYSHDFLVPDVISKEELGRMKAEWRKKRLECKEQKGVMLFGHCMVPAEWEGGDTAPNDRIEMGTHGMWKEHPYQSGYVVKTRRDYTKNWWKETFPWFFDKPVKDEGDEGKNKEKEE